MKDLLDKPELLEAPPLKEEQVPPSPTDALPPIVDAADFLAEKMPTPPELIQGVLHQGSKLVLGGGSKSYKTWTLLDLAVSVAHSCPWLSFTTTKGRVLVLNFELQRPFIQDRLQALARAKAVTIERGQIDMWNLRGYASSYDTLIPQVIQRTKDDAYSLIILDPIYKLYGDTDENSAGAVAKLLNAIERLAVETEAAVAFGAHYSKGNQAGKEAIDRISGSGVFARDPDAILNFTSHEEPGAFVVEATLRNFKPVEPFAVRWDYPLMRRDDGVDPSKLKKAGRRSKKHTLDKLLPFIRGRKLSSADWFKVARAEAGISKSRFYALLAEARKHPHVKQTPEEEWVYEDTPAS